MSLKILIAEDEDITRKHLIHALTREGYEVEGVNNGRSALELIERGRFDVLITDIKMPEMNGMELLERVKQKCYGVEVLIITGFGSIDSAVEAMKKGAYEYITKPFNLDELIMKIRNIHERKALKRENAAFRAFFGMNRGPSVVARSASMKKIMDGIVEMKDSDCNVLLTGEVGVGKGLLAKVIHFTGRRRNMPFLSLNCSTVVEDFSEQELFGREADAGPGGAKQGLIEIADAGTLFLDDVSELSPALQTRLLKVIEEGEFVRMGGSRPIKADVRFIAAAGGNIGAMVRDGRFSETLYYRLNVMEINVPPLRERREDIVPLGEYFLGRHTTGDKRINGFELEAMDILMNYSFPGNVRELENIVERAALLEKGPNITAESLPRSLKVYRIETFHPDGLKTVEEVTREYSVKVLELEGGDISKAACVLGVSESELRKLLKEEK